MAVVYLDGSKHLGSLAGHAMELGRWLIYLVVLAAIAGVLLAVPERPLPVPGGSLPAVWLESQRPKKSERETEPAVGRVIKTLESSREGLSAWLSDDTWRAGVARYLESAVEPQSRRWVAPPAGRPIPVATRARQDAAQTKASSRTYQRVDVELKSGIPQPSKGVEHLLRISAQGHSFVIELPEKKAVIEPLTFPEGEISLRFFTRRWEWFAKRERPLTEVATVPVGQLRVGAVKEVILAPLEGDARSGLRVRLAGGSTDIHRSSRGSREKSEIVKVDDGRVAVHAGGVSLEQLHAADHLFLRRSNRYTAIVVLGSSDLRDRVWCERDDDGRRVGSYAPDVPAMVAAANAWASLRLTVEAHESGAPLSYQVLAISDGELPGRKLVLEVIGRHLGNMEVDGRPVSGPAMRSTLKWLAHALDARFVPEDAQAAYPPEVRALVSHLVEITAPGTAPAGEPSAEQPR